MIRHIEAIPDSNPVAIDVPRLDACQTIAHRHF